MNTSGYCGSCGRACLGLTGEAKERALAAAREKYMGKPRMKSGRVKRGRRDAVRRFVQDQAVAVDGPEKQIPATAGQGEGGKIRLGLEELPEFLQGIDLSQYRVVVILAR